MTDDQKIAALMKFPWTIAVEPGHDGTYNVATVAELPSAIATGATERELHADLYESIHATLSCYLQFGDPIPLPTGHALPWES